MREIKFRAWGNYAKKMLPQEVLYWDRNKFITGIWDYEELYIADRENDNLIIMQYTGLKDKNGKEIYEGDIISADFDGEEMLFEVAWNENAMAWDIKDKNGVFYFDIYENGSPFKFLKNIKIIGNIYENPELLKEIK